MSSTDMPKTLSTPEERCRYHQTQIFPARRVSFCGRCGHATGGGYGHLSSFCDVEQKWLDDSHQCCPGSCERVDGQEIDPVASCHPSVDDPAEYKLWMVETDAAREARWRGDVG